MGSCLGLLDYTLGSTMLRGGVIGCVGVGIHPGDCFVILLFFG